MTSETTEVVHGRPRTEKPGRQNSTNDHFCHVTAEALFVILPLLVIAIVVFYTGRNTKSLFSAPEWSFGAAVFWGQALVKFVSGLSASKGRHYSWQRIALIVSLTIVVGLAPALLILALIMLTTHPSNSLIYTQVAYFAISLLVFLIFGTLGERMIFKDTQPTL